jgi:MarR family transcriptional regulator, transcriptional regulator for hemolysin
MALERVGSTKRAARSRDAKKRSAVTSGKAPGTSPVVDADEESYLLGLRIAFHIHDVSRMRRSAYDQIMKPLGITRAQWWVLAHLSRHDGMMQTQLADVLDVGKASIGTLLQRLEVGGFIERRPDATDKRARRVFMMRAAHQLMKKLTIEEAKFNDRILHSLSRVEREQFLHMLSLIKKAISEFHVPPSDAEAD